MAERNEIVGSAVDEVAGGILGVGHLVLLVA